MNWALTRTDECVLEVRCIFEKNQQEFNFLLTSDVHFDHPKCKRKLYFKHLEEAREKGAGVFNFGDWFCFMQGKNDRRRAKESIRPEHNTNAYHDSVINDSADQISDYADLFIMFSDGNHETAIVRNVETNPLERLTSKLNAFYGGKAHHLPYQGVIRFVFTRPDGTHVRAVNLAFHHGKWGGVVSKGVQSVARFASIFPDADIVVSGHTHDKWVVYHRLYRLRTNGKLKQADQVHIKTGSYKDEFSTGAGFAVEKIVQPKPLGGWWLTLAPDSYGVSIYTNEAK